MTVRQCRCTSRCRTVVQHAINFKQLHVHRRAGGLGSIKLRYYVTMVKLRLIGYRCVIICEQLHGLSCLLHDELHWLDILDRVHYSPRYSTTRSCHTVVVGSFGRSCDMSQQLGRAADCWMGSQACFNYYINN